MPCARRSRTPPAPERAGGGPPHRTRPPLSGGRTEAYRSPAPHPWDSAAVLREPGLLPEKAGRPRSRRCHEAVTAGSFRPHPAGNDERTRAELQSSLLPCRSVRESEWRKYPLDLGSAGLVHRRELKMGTQLGSRLVYRKARWVSGDLEKGPS